MSNIKERDNVIALVRNALGRVDEEVIDVLLPYLEKQNCHHMSYEVEWRFNNGDPVYTCGGCNTIVGRVPRLANPKEDEVVVKRDDVRGILAYCAAERSHPGAGVFDRLADALDAEVGK